MKSIDDRCTGSKRIVRLNQGRGNTLKFVNVPDSMSGAFLEELCGLDSPHTHPLADTAYFVENLPGNTFNVIVFQNDLKKDIAQAYASWFMGHCYMKYADEDTKFKIETAKGVPA